MDGLLQTGSFTRARADAYHSAPVYEFLRRYYVGRQKVRRILRRMKGSCRIPTLKTRGCVGLILRTLEGVRGNPTLLSSGPMPNFSPGLENFQEVLILVS